MEGLRTEGAVCCQILQRRSLTGESGLTDVLSLGTEDVDVHGREDVRVDDALFSSGLFHAGVDGVGVPVGPEQSVLVQGEGERVRQLPFNHHLPETHHIVHTHCSLMYLSTCLVYLYFN